MIIEGRTILVVDDSKAARASLEEILPDFGYRIVTALSGEQALERLSERPDLVLLDLHMKGIGGYEVLERMKDDPATTEIPVILLTAMSDVESRIKAFDMMADDYILKPFNTKELLVRMERLLKLRMISEERRRAERELQEERNFVSAILDTSGALVFVLDVAGGIVRFNRTCETITGYSFEEVKGKQLWDFLVPSEETGKAMTVVDELLSGDFPKEYGNYWMTRDGGRRLIHWRSTCLLDKEGKVSFVVGTGIDISGKKETGERLRTLAAAVEQSSEGIAVADLDGKVIYANRAWGEMHGWREEDLVGKRLADFHTAEQCEKELTPFNEKVLARGRNKSILGRVRKDGAAFKTWTSSNLLKDHKALLYCISDLAEIRDKAGEGTPDIGGLSPASPVK